MLFLFIFILVYVIIVVSFNLYYRNLFIKDYKESMQKYNYFCYDTTLTGFYGWWDDHTDNVMVPLLILVPVINIIITIAEIIFFIKDYLGKIKII